MGRDLKNTGLATDRHQVGAQPGCTGYRDAVGAINLGRRTGQLRRHVSFASNGEAGIPKAKAIAREPISTSRSQAGESQEALIRVRRQATGVPERSSARIGRSSKHWLILER